VPHAWPILKGAARQLGFSYVELKLHPRFPGANDAAPPRYAQRLQAPPASEELETTFAVALAGRGGPPGQVIFSRFTAAAPLHSELPLLISAVAQSLPGVIERDLKAAGVSALRAEPDASARRGVALAVRAGQASESKHHGRTCVSCGSSRVHRLRSTSLLDQLRKRLTTKRLCECSTCGWRGWRQWATDAHDESVLVVTPERPDLQSLDLALQNVRAFQR
jgi:hypothetical protein